MKTTNTMRNAECGTRNPVSRATHHGIRTPHSALRICGAFTLIELLVVIAIIGLLAGLTFPAVTQAKIAMMRKRAQGELNGVAAAIERYQQKLGYYPPDNAPTWDINPLYYELLGTTNVTIGGTPYFQTLDGSARIAATTAAFQAAFGAATPLTGFLNLSRGGGDGLLGAAPFLTELKGVQYQTIPSGCTLLGTSLDGPLTYTSNLGAKLNPWRYNSSNPRYNPKSFDLWIDVTAGSKTNRICNWSDRPLVVSTPYP